jgi:biopolymer transport protein ExbD
MEFELPKAENLSNIAQTPLKITIISEKSIVVGSKKTNLANFSVVLSESTSADATAQKSVILYGNKSIEYELLIQVMDTLKECGYDSIDLALDRK